MKIVTSTAAVLALALLSGCGTEENAPAEPATATAGIEAAKLVGSPIRVGRRNGEQGYSSAVWDMQAIGPDVWVSLPFDSLVVRVDGVTGAIDARAKVAGRATEMALAGDVLYAIDERDREVERLSARTGKRVAAPVAVGEMPGSIAASRTAIWVGDQDAGTVHRIDLATGKARKIVVDAGSRFGGIAASGGEVWVVDQSLEVLTAVSEDGAEIRRQLVKLPGKPQYGIAADGSSLWVALYDRAVRIDAATSKVTGEVDVPGDAVAVDVLHGEMLISTATPQATWRVDTATSRAAGKPVAATLGTLTEGGAFVADVTRPYVQRLEG